MDFSKKNDQTEGLEEKLSEKIGEEINDEAEKPVDEAYEKMYKKVFGNSDEDDLTDDLSEEDLTEETEDDIEYPKDVEPAKEETDAEPEGESILESTKPTKKKGKGRMIIATVLLVIFVAILGVAAFFAMDIYGWGGNNDVVYIEIREGSGLKEIAGKLKERDIITSVEVFYLYAKDRSLSFKSGGHVFNTAMSYDEICDELSSIPKTPTVKVLIPEGYELRLIAGEVEKAGLVSAEEFMDSAENDTFDYDFLDNKNGVEYRLEGFLFPATYEFKYGTSAHDIIDKMLRTFDSMYSEEYSQRTKELGMTDYEVVTLASVVEREAASVSEHKKVAGVFYNRLDVGMKLESCATVQYVLKERKPVLSVADTKIDSLYNTYKYSGLPVGPVASPSLSAIDAVLYPEEHDYYFFVARADGKGHVFSRTLEEHNIATAQNQ